MQNSLEYIKYHRVGRSGFSAFQTALGRDPPLPASIAEELPDPVANACILTGGEFARAQAIRIAARLASVELDKPRRSHHRRVDRRAPSSEAS